MVNEEAECGGGDLEALSCPQLSSVATGEGFSLGKDLACHQYPHSSFWFNNAQVSDLICYPNDLQCSAKRWSPGCVNTAGKVGQMW